MGSATADIKIVKTFSNTHWDLWPRLLGSLLPFILFHSALPTVPQPPRGAAPLSCCLRLLLLCGAIWWHLMLSALLGSQQGVAASQPYGVQPPIHPPPPRPPSCCLYFVVVVIVVDANAKRAFGCSDAWAEPSLRCTWLRMREARSKRGHSKNIQQQQAESPLPFLPLSPTSLPFSSLLPKLCERKQAGGNFNVRMCKREAS